MDNKEIQDQTFYLFTENIKAFILSCRTNGPTGEFTMCKSGHVTLYSSCFAVKALHYLNALNYINDNERKAWIDYINQWQDPETGLFIGPEIVPGELTSEKHDYEHVTMHLTSHVLPALHLLGSRPGYPLFFGHRFLDKAYLKEWLERIDWKDAWLKGNDLLFVGQFLIYFRDWEKRRDAQAALNLYFEWLDAQVDPATGLWGTNGFCPPFVAMCGGYHQLLVYYYEDRDVRYKKRLVDTVLSLQHPDGGFHPNGGGGACEDIDAADILVNMYKKIDYRRVEIRSTLRKLLRSVLGKHMPDGGFVYRLNEPFIHNGILATSSPAGSSNLFSTWFRVHTLALISEILTDEIFLQFDWQFNNSCSMGWHRPWDKNKHSVTSNDRKKELFVLVKRHAFNKKWYVYQIKRLLLCGFN